MLDKILAFFQNPEPQPEALSVDDAAVVLLIEIMLADYDIDQRERDCISTIVQKRTGCTEAEAENCIELAMARQQESYDLYQFTTIINSQWTEDQRFELLTDLWRVAFADGRLDKYEDNRIRRVTELLHLYHSHFIQAKAAAQTTVG